ncbi:MAG: preprotein translocase subunit SecD [Nanoarchaeota archaeon]
MKLTWRIWILIFVLMIALLIISPKFDKGVVIKSVEKNSTVYNAGLRQSMIITSINGEKINNLDDYTKSISSIFPVQNKTKITISTKDSEFILFTDEELRITVSDTPKTKIKTGLDLSGGSRALVKAQDKILSYNELNDLIAITNNRLNEFGIADISVKSVSDLSGNNFMLVEVAGATPSDIENLISTQGKFEAKIGNETIFIGGQEDVTYVARTGQDAGIYACNKYQEGEACNFRFAISLSEKAAQSHAAITNLLSLDPENPQYLSKKLDLYLDDKLVDSLFIGKELKGSATTQISISGSGTGAARQEAYDDALNSMKHLQTILITGSLPYKLEIVKIDAISPALGKEFTKNLIIFGLLVFFAISVIIFLVYRKIKITLAVILTMFSEAIITIGLAALIKWNLDAPSIAGIIAGMGTGVNDQMVILSEAVSNKVGSLKERIKNAFFIISGAFLTIVAAMLPLFWAGAGLLKGFALTTILGVSIGILITRPAFSDIIKLILKE